jgi:predicted secreted protein
MAWYSALALYLLFWVLCLFLVLPWGVRTVEEEGGTVGPGHAPSAPARPALKRKLLWTTLISALLFGIFWLNWETGFITRADLERLHPLLRD